WPGRSRGTLLGLRTRHRCLEALEGLGRREGLGHPPRGADAGAERPAIDEDLDPEDLLVFWSEGREDAVSGAAARRPLGQLLEAALGTLEGRGRGRRLKLGRGDRGDP